MVLLIVVARGFCHLAGNGLDESFSMTNTETHQYVAVVHQALPWSLLRFCLLGLVGLVSHKVSRIPIVSVLASVSISSSPIVHWCGHS